MAYTMSVDIKFPSPYVPHRGAVDYTIHVLPLMSICYIRFMYYRGSIILLTRVTVYICHKYSYSVCSNVKYHSLISIIPLVSYIGEQHIVAFIFLLLEIFRSWRFVGLFYVIYQYFIDNNFRRYPHVRVSVIYIYMFII